MRSKGEANGVISRTLMVLFVLLSVVNLLHLNASESGQSELNFEHQNLVSIPTSELCARQSEAHSINVVSFANNRIRQLEPNGFTCVSSGLKILILRLNSIERISETAFAQLEQVQVLLLDNNQLSSIPSEETFAALKSLRHLNLANNRIETLQSGAFGHANANLISLNLKANPLRVLEPDSLVQLVKLKTLTLSQSKLSGSLTKLHGLVELRFYYVDRATNLTKTPDDLCQSSAELSSLILKSNQLEQIPTFAHCLKLLQLDLSHNRIHGILSRNFTNHPNLIDLYLAHNQIRALHEHAFAGLSKLQVLELNDNQLVHIHSAAFLPIRQSIYDLNLANNQHLAHLPKLGLDKLASLKAFGNPKLRELPHFDSAISLALTFAYHCCDYPTTESTTSNSNKHIDQEEAPAFLVGLADRLRALLANGPQQSSAAESAPDWNDTDGGVAEMIVWPDELNLLNGQHLNNLSAKKHAGTSRWRRQLAGKYMIDDTHWMQVKLIRIKHSVDVPNPLVRSARHLSRSNERQVQCKPKPNAFLPCQDLFDTWWLRVGIWCVFLLAFTGNVLVIVVLSSVRPSSSTSALTSIMWLAGHSKRHIDVPRFLVINLAVADLIMALYLGLLAFVDLSTLGEFRLFAIKWQYSNGCKLAGFLGVLSSELSVFILAIITLERNYAITNAVHLNRRLSLQKAMVIMLIGYAFALCMALMPLNGISDYRKFSICLPLDINSNFSSQLYVITLIGINAFSFILLLSCYLRMYCAIRGSQAWNTNDLRIAKRMSILVITDFLCWMPIIVVSIASLFGYHLIGTNGMKILTIFILPLNSIANPFLYAITTKKFKRDLETLMRRMRSLASLNCSKVDQKDPKLFLGYNQYQHNLMMSRKKRQAGDCLAIRQPHNNRYRCARAGTVNQVTMNRTTCSCQQARVGNTHLQPKIVLDPVEPALEIVTPCLVKKSYSTNLSPHQVSLELRQPIRAVSGMAGYIVMASEQNLPVSDQQVEDKRLLRSLCASNQRSTCRQINGHSSCAAILHEDSSSHNNHAYSRRLLCVEPQNNDRSASACGYRPSAPNLLTDQHDEVRVSGSCEAMRSTEKISRSINRLLFGPIAKAWSSIHISLNSSANQVAPGHSSTKLAQVESSSTTQKKEQTTIDDVLLMSSPSIRMLRNNERRMSRSCDAISKNSGLLNQSSSGNQESSSSQDYYDDDQRILLATINRMACVNNRSKDKGSMEEQPQASYQYIRNRCKRCRSWSPALLSKLEDCIYQFKLKMPLLGSRKSDINDNHYHQDSEAIYEFDIGDHQEEHNSDQLNFVDDEEVDHAHGDSDCDHVDVDGEDLFNERGLLEWSQRREKMVRKYQSRRHKLQQQSSMNSDTLSTRTGGTVFTNVSVSFDSNTGVPNANQRGPIDSDCCGAEKIDAIKPTK